MQLFGAFLVYVMIDTSSMLFGFANGRNVFDIASDRFHKYRKLVSRGIVGELRAIAEGRGRRGVGARLALAEIRAKKIGVDNNREADLWILRKAQGSAGSVVITNDTALASALLRARVAVFKLSRGGILKQA